MLQETTARPGHRIYNLAETGLFYLMNELIGIRSILFVLVAPALVTLLYWAATWSIPLNAEDVLWSVVSVLFVLFLPGLILALLDQVMFDRKVRFRPLYLTLGIVVPGYTLLGFFGLWAPLFWLPMVFALPYGFCSWAGVRMAQLACR